jgi:hypothetical protein
MGSTRRRLFGTHWMKIDLQEEALQGVQQQFKESKF